MSFASTFSEETESQQVTSNSPTLETGDDSKYELGKRAGILKDALNKTFERCIGSIKLAEFKEHFKEIDEHYPDVLEDLHEQLTSQLYCSIQAEAESIYRDENILKLLNVLDTMILESKSNGGKKWRPSGNPEEDVRDHLHQVKLQHKMALENHLQELSKKNEVFSAQVEKNHNEILRLSKLNESYIGEMKNVTEALRCKEMDILKEKIHCQLMQNCDLDD